MEKVTARIKELQDRAYLSPGDELELAMLLEKKWGTEDLTRKGGLQEQGEAYPHLKGKAF